MAVDIVNTDSVHNTAVNLTENSQISSILNGALLQRCTVSMDGLLSDNGGVNMFYVFLNSQYSCGHFLEFWFACKGFRSRSNNGSPERLFQVAKIIYRTYIKPGTNRSVPIAPHLKHEVVHRISAYYEFYKSRPVNAKIPEFDCTIFDRAQDAIKEILADTYYPKFLEHLKSPTVNNQTVSIPSNIGFSSNLNELLATDLDVLQPFLVLSNSPWTKLFKRKNYRRVENNLSNVRRSSTPDVSSHCSPPFSPLLEAHGDMSIGIGHPAAGTPNIAVEAGTALDDGSCYCCCGCPEDCPRYADEALVAGDSHRIVSPRQSSDLAKDCTTATIGTSQSSNCLGPRVEDTCASVPLLECHPRQQASNSPNINVQLRPLNLASGIDTCSGMNRSEDPLNGDKVHCQPQQIISAGNDLEKPTSTVHSDTVTRSNLAQTDPALFVFLLTKRLEKVKEVHEKMEKLKLWVNQVDEKNHVSSSLIGQEDTCFMDGTGSSTGKDQSLTNHKVTRTHYQVPRRAEVAQFKRTPWTQNVESLEDKTVGAANGADDAPMTSEDDAQGILDDHCSRIWADEKEVFRGHRRISQLTTRRSRTAWPSMQDATRTSLSGQHHRAVVPISLPQQPNDTALTAARHNSSRARATSSVTSCSSAQVGGFCSRAACANSRCSDARSTTSWDSGVVPEPVCPSHVYHRQQEQHRQKQQQERPSCDLQSACPPTMSLYQDQTDDLDRPIDDWTELDAVFTQLEEDEDGSRDIDTASLQALSSSTTELAVVNSEVTAKLVQHMARHYTRSAGQRAHSSQGHVVPDLGRVPSHVWSPNPFVRVRRDKEATATVCRLHYGTPAAAQYMNEQHQHTTHLPDWERTGTQNSMQYPGNAGLLMTSQYGRSSARTRVFPTPSDTSSTFDSGISSTYDQLSLGEQDNRSRRLRHWPPDRRNAPVTVVTKYSRTPSVPRQPMQSCPGNFQWQPSQQQQLATSAIGGGLPTPAAEVAAPHHHDPCPKSHRLHSPGSGLSPSSASVATCAHCHPHCHHQHHHHLHHHHMFHRPEGMHVRHQYQPHHLHHAGLCQSFNNNGSSGSTVHGSSCSNRSARSSNPGGGGGQLLQHWLAYQQQSTDGDQLERDQDQRDESACYARGIRATNQLQPGNLRKFSTAGSGEGQHRRSQTMGHRHRQRAGGDDCGPEVSVSDSHQTTGANGTTAANSGGTPCSTSGAGIIVGYYLCDDPVPYRTVWTGPPNQSPVPGGGGRCLGATGGDPPQTVGALESGRTPGGGGGGGQVTPSLTLGQFKQLIAKKGSYRYFFKKPSNEFGTGVVHEELTHDDTFLPIWDGKVVARVERVD